MRVGIFSDTHSNLEALTAVLGAFKHEGVDKLVCLGDTVGYSASPNGMPKDHVISYCHGSPINIEEFEYIFAPEQAARCLPEIDRMADVTFIGHSHLCKSFALRDDDVHEVVAQKFELRPGHKYIISVGSVGQPRDYDNRASYTVYDSDQRVFEFKRVAYDIDSAAQKIFGAKLERNFGNRLFIGV